MRKYKEVINSWIFIGRSKRGYHVKLQRAGIHVHVAGNATHVIFQTVSCQNVMLQVKTRCLSPLVMSTPVGWGSTYCFTAVRVGVGVHVRISVTPITKGTPAQIFLGGMFFVGNWLLLFAMNLAFVLKVKP